MAVAAHLRATAAPNKANDASTARYDPSEVSGKGVATDPGVETHRRRQAKAATSSGNLPDKQLRDNLV